MDIGTVISFILDFLSQLQSLQFAILLGLIYLGYMEYVNYKLLKSLVSVNFKELVEITIDYARSPFITALVRGIVQYLNESGALKDIIVITIGRLLEEGRISKEDLVQALANELVYVQKRKEIGSKLIQR